MCLQWVAGHAAIVILRVATSHRPRSDGLGEFRDRITMTTASSHDDRAGHAPGRVPKSAAEWLDAVIASRLTALETMIAEQWRRLAPDEYGRVLPEPRRSAASAEPRALPGQGGYA